MGNMGYLTGCLLMAHNVPGTLLATEAIVVNETRYSSAVVDTTFQCRLDGALGDERRQSQRAK